ncbi:MAG: zf-HC2 domain-containing protein [Acetatifactor sp.]|nr:zf-HC2 domain-containing protein [Acetatifactor sp.]
MSKLNCEIIRDLIPSYVDGICSQSSREAVEEHVEECVECRASLETLRRTVIGGNKINQSELDHMKKVKQHFIRKSVLIVGALALVQLLVGDTFYNFELWYREGLYYVIFPLIALGIYALLSDYHVKPVMSRRRVWLGVVSALGIPYCASLAVMVCRATRTDMGPFGMEISRMGPFIDRQLTGIIIVELLIFACFVADSIKRECALSSLHIISLLGAFLCMVVRTNLRNMSDPAAFQGEIIRSMAFVVLEGLVIAGLELGMNRSFSQKSIAELKNC